MIELSTLKEIGKLKGIRNVGYAEKDYLQDIFLLLIYRHFDILVFKGGTCLYKLYKLDRFSEDLDFSAVKEFDFEHFLSTLKAGLEKFGITTNNITHKKMYNSFLIKWRVAGPLFTGSSLSLCTIRVDINTKSEVKKMLSVTVRSLYPDIPTFDILAMDPEEILCEKVRAIIMRTKARDVYDLWFLLQSNTKIDFPLIDEKLLYYGKKYTFAEFKKHLHLKKEIWESELTPFLSKIPLFHTVQNLILEKVGRTQS